MITVALKIDCALYFYLNFKYYKEKNQTEKMAPKKEVKSCMICCENFNKSNHKHAACQYCNYDTCTTCAETYLLGTTQDAHCMNDQCKKVWNQEFLSSVFTKKFVGGTYKKRREDLLFERERSMLPETQPYAESLKGMYELEKEEAPILKKIEATKLAAHKIQGRFSVARNADERLPIHKEMLEIKVEIYRLKCEREYFNIKRMNMQRIINRVNAPGTAGAAEEAQERRQFVRACPSNDCKGFLSSGWKCGLCEVRVCSDCHEIKETKAEYDARHPKGANGAASAPAREHTCKQENVETANLLKADSKNCPKCAAMIFKIEGCDQMYCTQCQTAFSWRTGRIETGTIHNPHYYEYLRRQNGGVAPRNVGDYPCGGMPTAYDLRKCAEKVQGSREIVDLIMIVHRLHGHIQYTELPRYTTNAVADNRDLRAAYLIQKIDEEKFKHTLQKNEKARNKKNDIRMVVDMFLGTIADIMRNIVQSENLGQILERVDELNNLRTYFNDSMKPISQRYGCVAPNISDKWAFLTFKY